MSIVRQFEKRIDETLRRLFRGENKAEARELIEIELSILEEIGERVVPAPRGKRMFPYNDVRLTIAATDPERKALFEAVFEAEALKAAIVTKLETDDAIVPSGLNVSVELTENLAAEIGTKGFYLALSNREQRPVARLAATQRCRFVVVHGSAGSGEWNFTKSRINVGRLSEIRDDQQRPIRRNDLVFDEVEGPPNSTVSRAHAHIRFEEPTGEFRIFDDQSAYGTGVFHEGSLTKVPPGAGRGVKLVSGDEIYFGQARVLFETGEE